MKQFARYLQIIVLLITVYVWGCLRLLVDIAASKNNALMMERIEKIKKEQNVDTLKATAINEITLKRTAFTEYSKRSGYLSLVLIAVIVCQLFMLFDSSVRIK